MGNYLTEYSKLASDTETAAIRNYLDDLAAIKTYDGNIITTHERILLENKNSSLFQGRTVLIDEDILRAMVSVKSISNEDILRVMHEPFLSAPVYEKLQKVLLTRDYQKLTKEEMGEIKGGYYSCPRSKGEFTRTYNALNKNAEKRVYQVLL